MRSSVFLTAIFISKTFSVPISVTESLKRIRNISENISNTRNSSQVLYLIPPRSNSSAMVVEVVTEAVQQRSVTTEPSFSDYLVKPEFEGLVSTEAMDDSYLEVGRGGGGGGYGGSGYGGLSTDPVSLLSLLTLGALVIRSLLNLTTTAAGRGLEKNKPLQWVSMLEDWLPNELVTFVTDIEAESLKQVRSFTGNLWSLRTVGNLKDDRLRNDCIRRVLCEHSLAAGDDNMLMKTMFENALIGAAWWYGDTDASTYLDTIRAMSKSYQADNIEKHCSNTTPLCPANASSRAKMSRFYIEQILSFVGF